MSHESRVTSHESEDTGLQRETRDSRLATTDSRFPTSIRPSRLCAQLLAALEATEGRRRRRKRDTTPDAIGLAMKRRLLEGAVRDDPEPEEFEGWLLHQCENEFSEASGPARAMALDILADWRLASISDAFRDWLEQGSPSEDAG